MKIEEKSIIGYSFIIICIVGTIAGFYSLYTWTEISAPLHEYALFVSVIFLLIVAIGILLARKMFQIGKAMYPQSWQKRKRFVLFFFPTAILLIVVAAVAGMTEDYAMSGIIALLFIVVLTVGVVIAKNYQKRGGH